MYKSMRIFRTITAAIMTVFILGSFTISRAATQPDLPPQSLLKISVLATSDIHGHIIDWNYLIPKTDDVGLAKIYTLVKRERQANPYTILVDAGDMLQGTPLTTYYAKSTNWKVHPMVQMYNFMGYDALTLGNHEFNYGTQYLAKAIAGANFPVLSANTYDIKTGKIWPAVKPYTIKQVEANVDNKKVKIKIAIIGVTTKAIPNWENEQNYAGLEFRDQVETVKAIVEKIKDKVDAIVVVSHSGVEIEGQESIPGENQVAAIAQACPEISLIVSGHKHQVLDNNTVIKDANKQVLYGHSAINGVAIVSPGRWGNYLAKADLTFTKFGNRYWFTNATTSNIPTVGVAPDRELSNIAWPYHDATLQYLNSTIGKAAETFNSDKATVQDTAMIDLVNDVQRYYTKADLSAAAMFNPKAVIKAGPVKLQDISSLYLYENFLYAVKINGAQLKQYLEHAARYYKQFKPGDIAVGTNGQDGSISDYNYDMIQGVKYTIDISQPIGSRIKNLTYKDTPVKENDVFSLALNDYRFNGGGGYMAAMGFDKGHMPEVTFDSQKAFGDEGQVRELLIRYVKEKGTINPVVDNNWSIDTGTQRKN
ncbi:MAG TPA: 5'-nucleotidase C-terminal domain-containing protein [Methylomusa anaerophila]|uniref:Trifunctional nucleotide phosphoesterase protein YfkN n=1 Tax=Methylomusa anaerophila TaxID=1930071 RepID=A0A348AJH9_9FIRM|nr:5'-nucleotidase C-terminal domain-containing protein [Methylomusa anaerophila]BBB91227.1 trifunctional nucleotide phosphoesterase protein YfkN precursor [Methylomusa anaerophila]HML89778.1 5'-nucleotidase C-terminal domain-containing protein [Methylomusa anaerophila]